MKKWITGTILPFLLKVLNIIILPFVNKEWLDIKTWFIDNWFIFINYFIIVLSYIDINGKENVAWAKLLLLVWIILSVLHIGYKSIVKILNK